MKNELRSCFLGLSLMLLPVMWLQGAVVTSVLTEESIKCAFDPDNGKPNPLGNRAFITVSQLGDDTHFRYEQFASVVLLEGDTEIQSKQAVTVESQRTLIFHNTGIEMARELVRIHNEYYYELIGFIDTAGFSSYDEAMSCV